MQISLSPSGKDCVFIGVHTLNEHRKSYHIENILTLMFIIDWLIFPPLVFPVIPPFLFLLCSIKRIFLWVDSVANSLTD